MRGPLTILLIAALLLAMAGAAWFGVVSAELPTLAGLALLLLEVAARQSEPSSPRRALLVRPAAFRGPPTQSRRLRNFDDNGTEEAWHEGDGWRRSSLI